MANKLQKKLDRASFRYEDVELCLNGDLASEREALRDEIDGLREKLSGRTTAKTTPEIKALEEQVEAIEAEMAEDVFTVRIRAMQGEKWKSLVAKHPPAKDNLIDRNKGYAAVAVYREAAESHGHYLDDDGTTEPIDPEQWKTLWESVSPGDLDRIHVAIAMLNENYGWQGVEFLKKD